MIEQTTPTILDVLIILIIAITMLVIYIRTLVRQLRKKQHYWFVITLLIPITLILYWIIKISGGVK